MTNNTQTTMQQLTAHGCAVKHFNIIEIVLAIGIIGIGLASVMVLFPVGSNAMRDAMTTGYSADMADQFLHQLRAIIQSESDPKWDEWVKKPVNPTYKPFLPDDKPDANADELDDFEIDGDIEQLGTAHIYYDPDNNNGVYKLLMGDNPPDENDFEAIMAVWKSKVIDSDSNYDYAVALNAEISWPAQIPYDQRQKEYYRLELFNRN